MVSALTLQLLHFGVHSLTAVITVGLGFWILTNTELSANRWIALWLGNFGVWSALSALSVVVSHQPAALVIFWLSTFSGITAIYLTYLFSIAYSGRHPLTHPVSRLAGGLYAVLALLGLTAPFHTLYWQSLTFLESPFPHFAVGYGPGWLATIVYSVGAVGVLFYTFAELYFSSRRQHRRLVVVLIAGGFAGFGPVLLSLGDLLVPTYEYLSVTGSIQAVTVSYVVLRFGSANLSSVAREETLDSLVDPYIALDTESRIVDFNRASGRLIEALDASRIGEPLASVFPALADQLTVNGRLDEPDEPLTLDVGGSSRYYSVDISEIADWHSTRCYAVVLNDVTELEATRREIKAQNEKLDAFVGTVSHDLRSPLSVIGGRLKLARMECESEHLDHIDEAHQRMDELIEDLLGLAREGQAVGDPTPVELDTVVEQAWRSVDTDSGSLAIDTDQTVLADRSRLQQLLENLLRNSLEHGIDSQTATATVDGPTSDAPTDAKPPAGDPTDDEPTAPTPHVEITVGDLPDGFYLEDNGPGIPEDRRQTIFEAGYTTDDGGTGFGLAIVTQIAEAHGWEIRATAGEAGGARFEITGVGRPS